MQVEALQTAARESTGHEDFGSPSYLDGLTCLVDALDHDAQLSEIGVAALESQLVSALSNRLRVVAWRAVHPEVAAERVARPLVVVGMPRTGTTLLSGLLACDPARRSLMRWEAGDCIPPPDTATLATDPRIEATRDASGLLDMLNPGFKAIHYEAPDGPTECVTLLAQDFTSLLWETVANVASYGEWLLARDQSPAYAYHHDVLQVLQSRAPGRWALKTPHHGLALDALFAQYPDAQVVVTHRDPVTVIASLCSLVRSLSGTFSDADHTAYIARRWPAVAEAIVTRITDTRATRGDAAFLDLQYTDLVADPLRAMRRIYAWAGDTLEPPVEARMRAYLADNAQGKHGAHTYALDDFNLHEDEIRERFATYTARYGVTSEPSRTA